MFIERALNIYLCTICGEFYLEDDMMMYNKLTRKGKCYDCVRELERIRKGCGVIGVEVSLENGKNV